MRFRFVKQQDSTQCGVAALSMICHHYGSHYSMESLSKICHTTTQGVSLKGLSDTAKILGLKTCSAKISITDLLQAPLPCVLHWNQNHFVVLYKIDNNGNRFWIADPAKGKYKYDFKEMCKHWISTQSEGTEKGIAMFLEPSEDFGKYTDNTINDRRSFKFLYGYILQYKRYFFQIAAGLALGCVLQLLMPFLTQWIVDFGIYHHDIGFIWLILIGEFMIIAGRTATDFIRRWLLLHISMRINISLISDFFIKLLKLPMSFFDTKHMGDLLQRMGDHGRIQSFLTNQVLGIIFMMLSFIVFGIVLFIYDSFIFLIFLLGSIIYGLWIATFLSRRRFLDYAIFDQQSINQNCTYQFITSMQEIKLQNCEQRRRWEWEDYQAYLFEIQMKSMKLQQTQEAGSVFINEIKNILITVFAATAVINGQITLGSMLAIQYIVGQLNSPVEQLMFFLYSLQDVKISLERINEIHSSKNEESNVNSVKSFSSNKNIEFDNISFKYDPHALCQTLNNVSFKIEEGKITAIVGASGSGKTTLIKLLLGYYFATAGDIRISGRSLKDYDIKWWRNQCGVVMQDGVIFSESIARNIAISDGDIDINRLEEAARIACIHDYVMSLPLKYNTKIGSDGIGLSQGQKQRILIARAIYKNPHYIFLDEATNSLDANNERMIVENLQKFFIGKTAIIVAHRLSTVKNADCIIVLDKGMVVERGTHSELIKNNGIYYNLVRNQLELGN